MTKLKTFILLCAFPLVASANHITGAEAEQLYNSLTGAERGPFCTGACLPGQPCDATCATIRTGDRATCTRTEHTNSPQIDYACDTEQN